MARTTRKKKAGRKKTTKKTRSGTSSAGTALAGARVNVDIKIKGVTAAMLKMSLADILKAAGGPGGDLSTKGPGGDLSTKPPGGKG